MSGLLVAATAAALVGIVSGLIILRTFGLTQLMLTLAIATLLGEAANKASFITGGNDGLQGIEIDPIAGLFRFDMFGRTGFLYCLIVLFCGWLFLRVLLALPFGQSLVGIRENVTRMHAIGAPVAGRLLIAAERLNAAASYAAQAAVGQAQDEVHARLQRVLNCLEGKKGAEYRQAPAMDTPCHDEGCIRASQVAWPS